MADSIVYIAGEPVKFFKHVAITIDGTLCLYFNSSADTLEGAIKEMINHSGEYGGAPVISDINDIPVIVDSLFTAGQGLDAYRLQARSPSGALRNYFNRYRQEEPEQQQASGEFSHANSLKRRVLEPQPAGAGNRR